MNHVVIEKISKVVGYEANMADICYKIKIHENLGLNFKFKGYNDKLLFFIDKFYEIYSSLVNGIKPEDAYLIDTAIEKVLKSHKNENVEVYNMTNINRLLYLL